MHTWFITVERFFPGVSKTIFQGYFRGKIPQVEHYVWVWHFRLEPDVAV
jgi:hypothetical protein